MKKKIQVLVFFLLTVLFIGESVLAQSMYSVKLDKSNVVWVGKKVTGEHTGNIQLINGEMEMEGQEVKSGKFEINMKSITNTDLKKEKNNTKLVNHLKSDDFFSVEKFPISSFVLSEAQIKEGEKYHIKGDLTIKGITHPIEFDANIHHVGDQLHVEAKMVVDRAKYDVRYGSGSFFSDLGNKMIYDEFDLQVNITFEVK